MSLVESTVASSIGVENPAKAIADSQSVAKVDEDTDLEEAAKFDFLKWLEQSGWSK